jgi:hypothetical protein
MCFEPRRNILKSDSQKQPNRQERDDKEYKTRDNEPVEEGEKQSC